MLTSPVPLQLAALRYDSRIMHFILILTDDTSAQELVTGIRNIDTSVQV